MCTKKLTEVPPIILRVKLVVFIEGLVEFIKWLVYYGFD